MDGEIVQVAERAGPFVSAALGAYGAGVLTRAEDAAVDASADLGRRILHAVWRRDAPGRPALEEAVRDAADEPDDPDAAAALRQRIKRALREDPGLLRELAAALAEAGGGPGAVSVTASGERSIAARSIGTAITGDHVTVRR